MPEGLREGRLGRARGDDGGERGVTDGAGAPEGHAPAGSTSGASWPEGGLGHPRRPVGPGRPHESPGHGGLRRAVRAGVGALSSADLSGRGRGCSRRRLAPQPLRAGAGRRRGNGPATSKSAVSCRFTGHRAALGEQRARDLVPARPRIDGRAGPLRRPPLRGRHRHRRHRVPSPARGTTENTTTVTDLLVDLRDRRPDIRRAILVVIDGVPARRSAVESTDVVARSRPQEIRCIGSGLSSPAVRSDGVHGRCAPPRRRETLFAAEATLAELAASRVPSRRSRPPKGRTGRGPHGERPRRAAHRGQAAVDPRHRVHDRDLPGALHHVTNWREGTMALAGAQPGGATQPGRPEGCSSEECSSEGSTDICTCPPGPPPPRPPAGEAKVPHPQRHPPKRRREPGPNRSPAIREVPPNSGRP
jgi:hypothetical protein